MALSHDLALKWLESTILPLSPLSLWLKNSSGATLKARPDIIFEQKFNKIEKTSINSIHTSIGLWTQWDYVLPSHESLN